MASSTDYITSRLSTTIKTALSQGSVGQTSHVPVKMSAISFKTCLNTQLKRRVFFQKVDDCEHPGDIIPKGSLPAKAGPRLLSQSSGRE